MKEAEYNKIAKGYEMATKRPLRELCYNYTVKNYIPDLVGKRVLDLACGEGVSTRLMKEKGATEVLGVDVSEELIKKAIEKGGQGITYKVFDVFNEDWSSLGKFDVITGIMIIHYSDTEEKIKKLFSNINKALKKDGVFYTLTINPDVLETGYKNYGVKISKAINEGDSVTTELHDLDWNKFCEFTNYFWSRKTYTKIFKMTGFNSVFKNGLVSPEGEREYGKKFWADYLKKPIYNFVIAKKVK